MSSTAAGKAGVLMSVSNAFSHLTLEERRIILTGITNGSTKTAIAQTIGKDKSTVGKEIKLHRALTHKCKMPLECNNYRKCDFGRQCTADWDGKRSSWLPLYTTIRKSPDGDEGRTYLRVYESQEICITPLCII